MTREEVLKAAQAVWGVDNWSDLQFDRLARFADMCADAKTEELCGIAEDEIRRVKPVYSVTAENILRRMRHGIKDE